MILYVPPTAPALVRDGAALILALHIGGGAIGMVSGLTALLLRKGSLPHRLAGDVFVVAMLVMASIGAVVSPFLPTPQPGNILSGSFAAYLVATGWLAARRRDGGLGRLEMAAMIVPVATVVMGVLGGIQALSSASGTIEGGVPYQALFGFSAVAALMAGSDVSVLIRRSLPYAQRISRHLWRMCVGLLIATGSGLSQPRISHLIPASYRTLPVLLAPIIVIAVLMLYGLVRMRLVARGQAPARATFRAIGEPAVLS